MEVRAMTRFTKLMVGLAVTLFLGATPYGATATPITFTGSSGGLSASASFEVIGSNLRVVLTNTSSADVLVPANVLTGLFFDLNGVGALTPVSALLSGGSTVFFGPNGGGNVGGEWAYASGIAAPGGATEGISSAGLGLFGAFNFGGSDLTPPTAVNGLNYGITSAGDNTATGNAEVTGNVPLIKNQVTFTLSGIPAGFQLDGDIAVVSFQYGTALTEPNVTVPEPGTLLLLGSGLIGLAVYSRKLSRKR